MYVYTCGFIHSQNKIKQKKQMRCCPPQHFFFLGLKRTLHPNIAHRTAGINNPNPPRCPRSSCKNQAGEEALILGIGRRQRTAASGSSRPPEGASRSGRRCERETAERRSGGTSSLEEEEDEKRKDTRRGGQDRRQVRRKEGVAEEEKTET